METGGNALGTRWDMQGGVPGPIWMVCGEKRACQVRRAVYEWAGLECGVTAWEARWNFHPGAWCLRSDAASAT